MSYSKIWKACQDYGVGITLMNAAKANLDAFKAAWETEHGNIQSVSLTQPPATVDPYNAFGVHNAAEVPRAMVRVKPSTLNNVIVPTQFIDIGGIVRGVSRVATGTWNIYLDGRLQLFFGDPRPVQSSGGSVRFCEPYGAVIGGGVGLLVKTYDLQSGDFALADYEFSCAIYSYS